MSGANTKRMPGLGDEFRAAREARHLSLSDVSEQIHIRSVYLQSIEDEDWSAIAAPVYVRGFIRTYARFLGLDPESAVERFNIAMGDAGGRHEPASVRQIGARRGPSPWLWSAIVVAVLLVAFVGYKLYDNERDGVPFQQAAASPGPSSGAAAPSAASPSASAASPSAASPDPNASGVAAAEPPPAPSATPGAAKAAKTLVVSITQTSWLLVTIDGQKIAEGIYPAGTIKSFHGKSASIRAGNAGGVNLTVNGKELGPLGASGSVVDKTIPLAEE